MKIIVLAGGLCPERNISLSSGTIVANTLIENGHDVFLLDLYLGINKKPEDIIFLNQTSDERYHFTLPTSPPDLTILKKENNNQDALIGNNVIELCQKADIVFIALHGDIGENGKLQALFDIYNIKYTGSGFIGSMLAMNKGLAKQIFVQNEIPTPNWQLINTDQIKPEDLEEIKLPCVVKPCSGGSSVGTSIVKTKEELLNAIKLAKEYENMILIEEMIIGREFSVGVLDNTPLPIIEICIKEGFFDYQSKYEVGYTEEICPALLDSKIANKMQELALKVHQTLKLDYYSRMDFLLDDDNNIYCIEANSLPGMTPTSLLPQEALAHGISYQDLCEKIINISINKKMD